MTKKQYVKPAMQVFELKQQPQLLAGSSELNSLDAFENGGDPLEEM